MKIFRSFSLFLVNFHRKKNFKFRKFFNLMNDFPTFKRITHENVWSLLISFWKILHRVKIELKISPIHSFVNIPALIRKRSVFSSSGAVIFTKVWIGDINVGKNERFYWRFKVKKKFTIFLSFIALKKCTNIPD